MLALKNITSHEQALTECLAFLTARSSSTFSTYKLMALTLVQVLYLHLIAPSVRVRAFYKFLQKVTRTRTTTTFKLLDSDARSEKEYENVFMQILNYAKIRYEIPMFGKKWLKWALMTQHS